MNEENGEKIRKLVNLTKEEIGKSEEDVKINFIVPLFEAFGHERLKFEHRWKDALIEKLDPSCKLVIETKNYDKDLDRELQQLERYCHEERPLLGIIANGTEIRIFSYFWKYRPTFQETLIYRVNRKDLEDEGIIQALENMLSRDNLLVGKAKEYITEREKEIESVENKIREIEEKAKDDEKNLRIKIEDLTRKVDEIKTQINHLNVELNKIKSDKNEQISRMWSNLGLVPPNIVEPTFIPPKNHSASKKSYRESYRKQLEDPNNLISKIRRYIREKGEVTYTDLKSICVSQFGCKSETSGSIGACVKVLEEEIGDVAIEGRGDAKRIIFIKKQ